VGGSLELCKRGTTSEPDKISRAYYSILILGHGMSTFSVTKTRVSQSY
jgi:hypothetical protein